MPSVLIAHIQVKMHTYIGNLHIWPTGMWKKKPYILVFQLIYSEGSLQDWLDNNLSSFKGSVIVCSVNESLLIRVQKKHVIHPDLHYQRFWTIMPHKRISLCTGMHFTQSLWVKTMSQPWGISEGGWSGAKGTLWVCLNLILFLCQVKN